MDLKTDENMEVEPSVANRNDAKPCACVCACVCVCLCVCNLLEVPAGLATDGKATGVDVNTITHHLLSSSLALRSPQQSEVT